MRWSSVDLCVYSCHVVWREARSIFIPRTLCLLPFLPPFARRALCYAVLLLAVVALVNGTKKM